MKQHGFQMLVAKSLWISIFALLYFYDPNAQSADYVYLNVTE